MRPFCRNWVNNVKNYLRNDEAIIFALRELYAKYGYRRYKMNKFEEYDFYADNKEFLVSGNVITFTDRSGRLMALKPDVTLSIARHHEDNGETQRVYYNENVYRAPDGEFREIPQTGLECIGDLDAVTVGEVVLLAVKSVAAVGRPFCLCVSHMELLISAIKAVGLTDAAEAALYTAVESKSVSRIREVVAENGGDMAAAEKLCALTSLFGSLHAVLPTLKTLAPEAVYAELAAIDAFLQAAGVEQEVQFDFSLKGDVKYYNGAVFCGFIEGVPRAILSGGRYDLLMEKLGKRADAIGFAVYLDLLERLSLCEKQENDTVVMTYTVNDFADTVKAAQALRADGKTVILQRGEDN